jgi:hypothetical protein
MALNTLSIAISVVHDLNSTGSDQTIINVFGDEVTEDSVIADLYKLFFVILTPFFIPLRDKFNSEIFDKFKSSGGSGITYASNMTAKILLYFKPESVKKAKKFFIGRYGNTITFNLKELNNDIKYNIVKTKLLDDNITMDMVKTLPQFIEHVKKSQRTNTEITFSYDFNTFANTGEATDKSPPNCTVCTRKDDYMTQFRFVARNIFYMFAAMDKYVETDSTFNTTLGDHNFQQLRMNPNACKCKSLDHLIDVNRKVGNYIEELHIKPFTFPESQQNTKALAYIMNYVVIPNNQLKQSPERRVIKITREMWKDFLTKKGSYAPEDASGGESLYSEPSFSGDSTGSGLYMDRSPIMTSYSIDFNNPRHSIPLPSLPQTSTSGYSILTKPGTDVTYAQVGNPHLRGATHNAWVTTAPDSANSGKLLFGMNNTAFSPDINSDSEGDA